MRQVADAGQNPVMLLGLHALDPGSAGSPERLDALEHLEAGLRNRRDHYGAALEQIRVGVLQARSFAAGDRMARYEALEPRPEHMALRRDHSRLRTAQIGEHR